MSITKRLVILFVIFSLLGCTKDNEEMNSCATENFFTEHSSRNFRMGFTSWSFGPDLQDVDDTYQFLESEGDIYAEHIDFKIPWNAWINDLLLPAEFTNEIAGRVARKINSNQLLVSVSLLNTDRSDLAEDFDGTIPAYSELNDPEIEDAYFKHIQYIVEEFQPDYLVIAIEVNELKLNAESKWPGYKLLIQNVKSSIKQIYPGLKVSESITLHNLYDPDVADPTAYINEMVNYMNQMDYVSISFYPFFKNLHSQTDFQQAFDFLHSRITKPIAVAETSHLAEHLSVPNLNLSIEGNECEQNTYLETLMTNAQDKGYEFVIWWAHRDYDTLWETFPDEVKDIGKLWRDTGLLDEAGKERVAHQTWKSVYNK